MKKAISLLLTLVLVLSCMTPALAVETATITSTVTTLECGEVVGITVKMPSGLPKLVGIGLQLTFDKSAFALDTVDADEDGMYDAQPEGWFVDEETGLANFMANNTVSGDDVNGKEYTFIFNSKVTAAAGNYNFVVTFDADNTPDANYSPVAITGGTVTVNVTTPPVAVTGVTLNKDTTEIVIDGEETLVATVAPGDATNKAVTWSSSDSATVAVDQNGKVTGKKVGTATITVTTADGGFTDTCVVTVSCGAHTGGTATCTTQAECSKCGASYGELAAHSFSEKIEDEAHKKADGEDCKHGNTYYFDCANCDAIATKDADTYVSTTKMGPHKMATAWTTKDEKHFHECEIDGCDYIEDMAACSGGTATCTAKAKCAACNAEYGALAQHIFNLSTWVTNGSEHWHKCNSCDAKTDVGAHEEGSTIDNKCDKCGAILCAHTNKTHHDAKPKDCVNPGNKEHWECDACHATFADEAMTTLIDPVIPASHELTAHAANPNSCETAGNSAYWSCGACGKYFSDAEAKTEIEKDSWVIAPKGHDYSAEWTTDADKHWHVCGNGCGIKADEAAHAFTAEVAEAKYLKSVATCTAKAVYYKSCVCGKASTEATFESGDVDKTNHVGGDMKFDANEHWGLCACGEQIDKEAHKGGAATCTHKAVCSVCSQAYGEIDATAHDFVDGVCSHNSKHVQFDKEPGAKVEDVIEGLVSADITVKQMVEGTLTPVADLTTLFKDGAISVAEGKLTYELLPAAPEGEYYVEIGEYVVMIVVEKADTDYDRPSRPTLSNDAVKKVIAMIDELPSAKKVTLNDQKDIEAARKAYDALSKANQAKVTNYEDLVEVEEALKALLATPEMPEINNPFVDVADDVYYTDAVLWAVENNITSGTGADTFSPNAICTRAQVVTFLWRAAGSPAPKSTEMPFTDVEAGAYYAAAVQWAVENNITGGTSATTFDPNGECTRGQIVTFLWRAEGYPAAAAVNAFADVAADAYYNAPVLWAVANGITNGTSATTFSPADSCTRAQVVTFLYRAMAK